MKLVFATHNEHKIKEIKPLLPNDFELVSLAELDCHDDIPETGKTLEENALIKANYVKKHYGLACFADDSGLEVDALAGAPGVFSARYGGPEKNNAQNIAKLLAAMEPHAQRKAQFRTVIVLLLKEKQYRFEGMVRGQILTAPEGNGGFGYDPIFQPEGYAHSFGILPASIKNEISHRAKAVQKMIHFLQENKSYL